MMWTDLSTANEERRDLSSLIVPGSRAVTIRTRREDSSAAMVKPGDYVDVIAVLQDPNTNANEKSAIVLLQRILVLASGFDTSPSALDLTIGKDRRIEESVLTLSLSLESAQKIAVAMDRGALSVVLRNPTDNTNNEVGKFNASALVPKDLQQTVQIKTGPTAIGPNR